ncbi:MAG: RpiB/LacA/LacB family sugar-phosphate isomerase [bacterium]|nr:RpiB/LacA/LacB family sugar-phosphate isomerase [bacterium]
MKVFFASDHAGFEAKDALINSLRKKYEIIDLGPDKLDPNDDYPVYAQKLSEAVIKTPDSMGILTCGSGEGMAIAANRLKGIRASVVWNEKVAQETRNDNDSNVLSLPAWFLTNNQMIKIAKTWLKTPFSNVQRHIRRIRQIEQTEN